MLLSQDAAGKFWKEVKGQKREEVKGQKRPPLPLFFLVGLVLEIKGREMDRGKTSHKPFWCKRQRMLIVVIG